MSVQQKPGCDAWAVWQQCVQMLGLISYIYLDQVIVTTALDYYAEKDAPRLIWGQNILSLDESRNTTRALMLTPLPQPIRKLDMAKWRRRMEANVDLCLNYCRAIAAKHLSPEQLADIEAAHRRREEEIAQTDPDMSDEGDGDEEAE